VSNGTTMSYDPLGRLYRIAKPGAETKRFQYDWRPHDRRV
jgi:YD repeat-containing protein